MNVAPTLVVSAVAAISIIVFAVSTSVRVEPEVEPLPAPPPKPSEEPTCFGRGIAKSIETEPEAWRQVALEHERDFAVCHRQTGVAIHGRYRSASFSWRNRHVRRPEGQKVFHHLWVRGGGAVNDADERLIDNAIAAHPIGQYADEIAEENRRAAKQAAAKAHFDSLGCPADSA